MILQRFPDPKRRVASETLPALCTFGVIPTVYTRQAQIEERETQAGSELSWILQTQNAMTRCLHRWCVKDEKIDWTSRKAVRGHAEAQQVGWSRSEETPVANFMRWLS